MKFQVPIPEADLYSPEQLNTICLISTGVLDGVRIGFQQRERLHSIM